MRIAHGDVTALQEAGLGAPFRLVLDTGTFHGLGDEQREAMGREVTAVSSHDATLLAGLLRAAAEGSAPAGREPGRRGALLPGSGRSPTLEVADSEPRRRSPGCSTFDERFYRLRRAVIGGEGRPLRQLSPPADRQAAGAAASSRCACSRRPTRASRSTRACPCASARAMSGGKAARSASCRALAPSSRTRLKSSVARAAAAAHVDQREVALLRRVRDPGLPAQPLRRQRVDQRDVVGSGDVERCRSRLEQPAALVDAREVGVAGHEQGLAGYARWRCGRRAGPARP